jgi:hypothetical protein
MKRKKERMKVNEEVKTNRLKWIRALESGKHKQTRMGKLSYHGRNCCLGVWCKIDGWHHRVDRSGDWVEKLEELSEAGRKSLGMTRRQMNQAITMNDSEDDPKTFTEIAADFRKIWRIKGA